MRGIAGRIGDRGVSALCAFLGACALGWIGVPAAAACALGAAFFAFSARFFALDDRRAKTCFGLLGAAFALCCALGFRLEKADETGWGGLIACAAVCLCAAPAGGWLFLSASRALERLRPGKEGSMARTFLLMWAVLLLCWLPVIIAYFPGMTGYDMDSQIYQITSGDYHAQHPLLHTLFVALFYKTLGPTLGYGIYSVLQAMMLSASIAYAMAWLKKIRCPRGVWMALAVFFALSPQHALLSMSGAKDVLFAAAMLIVGVEWCRLLTEPGRFRKPAVLMADVVMMAVAGMLRNNAVYGMALVFVVSLFFHRQLGRRVLAVLLAGLIAAFGGTKLINAASGARGVNPREMMSVPCQQLGRIYAKYGTSVPVGYEIPELLPDAPNYKADRADFTKRSVKVIPNDRMVRFLKLWAREALHYPIEYIDAFLLTTKGFWYLGDDTFATTYDHDNGSVGCLVLGHVDTLGIDAPWMLPRVREICRDLFTLNGYRSFAPGWLMMHPALYTWMLGFLIAWAAWRRQKGALIACSVMLGYLLTLFLGPCVIIRYQYYLMLAAPVILGYLCVRTRRAEVEA